MKRARAGRIVCKRGHGLASVVKLLANTMVFWVKVQGENRWNRTPMALAVLRLPPAGLNKSIPAGIPLVTNLRHVGQSG